MFAIEWKSKVVKFTKIQTAIEFDLHDKGKSLILLFLFGSILVIKMVGREVDAVIILREQRTIKF